MDNLKEYVKGEVVFNIENCVNDEATTQEIKEKLYKIDDDEIDNIADKILDNDWLWDEINFMMNEAIQDELATI